MMQSKLWAGAVLLAGSAFSASALADARQDVIDSFTKAFSRGEYTAQIATQVRGKDYTTTMRVEWPSKFHMKNPDTEMIILPQGTWMNAGGQWMQMPMNMSQMIASYSKDAMEKGIQGLGEVSEVGEETVEGCASKLYRYTASGEFMGVKSKSDSEVAICQDNGYPVRVRSRDGKDAVTIVYDFATDVDIQPPR